jgi:hypothetical protein
MRKMTTEHCGKLLMKNEKRKGQNAKLDLRLDAQQKQRWRLHKDRKETQANKTVHCQGRSWWTTFFFFVSHLEFCVMFLLCCLFNNLKFGFKEKVERGR